MAEERSRPNMDEYLMGIAIAVRTRANCVGNRVGAVVPKIDASFPPATTARPATCRIASTAGACAARTANRTLPAPVRSLYLCPCRAECPARRRPLRYCSRGRDPLYHHAALFQLYEGNASGRHPARLLPARMEASRRRLSRGDRKTAEPFSAGNTPADMEDPEAEWAVSTRRAKAYRAEDPHLQTAGRYGAPANSPEGACFGRF